MLKRAGLDYWDEVSVTIINNLEEYIDSQNASFYFFSSKAARLYIEPKYAPQDLLIFGSETSGLPEKFHKRWKESFYTIPMLKNKRSLNLANSASIVLFEALRQQSFASIT